MNEEIRESGDRQPVLIREVPWHDIHVEPGFNARDFASDENLSNVAALKASISAQGVRVPLVCREDESGALFIIDGESRWRAVQQLLRERAVRSTNGNDLGRLPVLIDNSLGETERVANLIVHNTACPLAEYEKATVIGRLLKAGWSQNRIGRHLGYSQSYVSKLAFVAAMPEDVFEALRRRKLSARQIMNLQSNPDALTILRRTVDGNAIERKGFIRSPAAKAPRASMRRELVSALQKIHALSVESPGDATHLLDDIRRIVRRSLLKQGFDLFPPDHTEPRPVRDDAEAPEFDLRFGVAQGADHPIVLRSLAAFKRIREETNGRVGIAPIPISFPLSPLSLLTKLQNGDVDVLAYSTAWLDLAVPLAGISSLGFVFDDAGTALSAMDGELGAVVRRQIAARGFFSLDRVWDMGFTHLNMVTKPIRSVDDLARLKIRVSLSRQNIDVMHSLGASPTSLPFDDVVSAFDAHLFDGVEATFRDMLSFGWDATVRYVSLTAHRWNSYWTLFSPKVWKSLPRDLQDIVGKHLTAATMCERKDMAEREGELGEKLRANGILIHPAERSGFKTKLRSGGYYGRWRRNFGEKAWLALQRYAEV